MEFKAEEITSVIKTLIEKYHGTIDISKVGRVLEVGDGIARIYGLSEAMAGEMLGQKLLYLEAGSGAIEPVKTKLISEVKKNIQIPLIVGGGIQHPDQIRKIFLAGADIIVVGTAFENNVDKIPVLADAVKNLPSMQ